MFLHITFPGFYKESGKSSVRWIEKVVVMCWWLPDWTSFKRYRNSNPSCSRLVGGLQGQSFHWHRHGHRCCGGFPVFLPTLRLLREPPSLSSQKFELWFGLFSEGDRSCLSSRVRGNQLPSVGLFDLCGNLETEHGRFSVSDEEKKGKEKRGRNGFCKGRGGRSREKKRRWGLARKIQNVLGREIRRENLQRQNS